MKKIDVITIGGATRDVFFKTDKDWILKTKDPKKRRLLCLEYGAKLIPSDVHFSFGGGAINTATSFARLGLKAETIISLGCDETADVILDSLKKEGVTVNNYICRGLHRTGISFFILDHNGDHTAVLYRGTNDKLKITNWDFLKRVKWLYVSSLTGESNLILSKLFKELKNHIPRFAWNPGSTQLKKGFIGLKNLLKKTDVLILNKDEAIELVLSKEKNFNCQEVSNLILEIKKWGPKIVVITDSINGAYAIGDKEIFKVPALKTKVIDTTGAGDAFGSSFVAGLEIFGSIKKSLALASINSSSVVSRIGAQNGLLSFKKIKGLKKIKILEIKPKRICRA